jgi:hypothetical protein
MPQRTKLPSSRYPFHRNFPAPLRIRKLASFFIFKDCLKMQSGVAG